MAKFNSDWIERNVYYCRIGTTDGAPHYRQQERRVIVCLCGSTRFKKEFFEANFRETMAGKIVLSVGFFGHADAAVYVPSDAEKTAVDELHLDKIALADEVLVLNVDGYVGDSTRREVLFAAKSGKTIRWLEPFKVPVDLAHLGDSLSYTPLDNPDRDNDPDRVGA